MSTMSKKRDHEAIDRYRRSLMSVAAIAIAAAATVTHFTVRSAQAGSGDEIRPFRVKVPEKDLVDLRRRLKAVRANPDFFIAHWDVTTPGEVLAAMKTESATRRGMHPFHIARAQPNAGHARLASLLENGMQQVSEVERNLGDHVAR
jgi:sirohydrochlorin ferrochelatase